jgi:hypothetical protein
VAIVAVNSWPYSDHSPFWNAGYPALCAIENEDPSNPHYHKVTDTLATLTMPYALLAARTTVAAAAELARPVSTPASPSGLVVRRQILRALYLKSKTVGLRWNPNQDAVIGYHVHRSTTAGGPYERLTAAPLASTEFTDRFLEVGTSYYYVVTAVDAQGRTSRASLEVVDSEETW